jgi:hypothetical protein
MTNEDGDEVKVFVYRGQKSWKIPRKIIRVSIHPSVKAIEDRAFVNRKRLTTVILGEGLEEIGANAFESCTSLRKISAIKDYAFWRCDELKIANLGEGLEEIGEHAFEYCGSLESLLEILIPPAVKVIKDKIFGGCVSMTTAILSDGLEEVGGGGIL